MAPLHLWRRNLNFVFNADNYFMHHRDFAFLAIRKLNLYLTKTSGKRQTCGFDSRKQIPCKAIDETHLQVVKELWSPWNGMAKKQFNGSVFILWKAKRSRVSGCTLLWEDTHGRAITATDLRNLSREQRRKKWGWEGTQIERLCYVGVTSHGKAMKNLDCCVASHAHVPF